MTLRRHCIHHVTQLFLEGMTKCRYHLYIERQLCCNYRLNSCLANSTIIVQTLSPVCVQTLSPVCVRHCLLYVSDTVSCMCQTLRSEERRVGKECV